MLRTNNDTQLEYAQSKAYEVLIKYSNGDFPINPFKIANQIEGLKVYPYKILAKKMQRGNYKDFSISEILTFFPSEEGFIKKTKKGYIIAYNEDMSSHRIKWTIFHELGHYFCEHLEHNNSILFSNVETYNTVKEREANHFALQCCCPAPVILKLLSTINKNPEEIISKPITGMSKQVNDNCINYLKRYSFLYKEKNYLKLLKKFENGLINTRIYFNGLSLNYYNKFC